MNKLDPTEKSVLEFSENSYPFDVGTELTEKVIKEIEEMLSYKEELIHEGINCQLLRPDSKGWIRGKIKLKLSLDFIPNDPLPADNNSDSPSGLDSLRCNQ